LKKTQDNATRASNGFVLNIMGDLKRFEKGMSKKLVLEILGNPIKTEECSSLMNQKMTFKIYSNDFVSTRYSVLFTNDELVYIAKLN